MAADGWFPQWFAGAWFPPVWFAPADEEHLTPEEQRPQGGGMARPRRGRISPAVFKPRPFKPSQPVKFLPRNVEEDDALLLLAAL